MPSQWVSGFDEQTSGSTRRTILDAMGGSPVHEITSKELLPDGSARLFVKLEEFNPGGSIKSRIALAMVQDAERQGKLRPDSGQTLIEPTGGNTGTGLAMVGSIRGYRVVLVVPDNYASSQRLRLLQIRGAEIIQTDHTQGNDSHIRKVVEMCDANPSYVWLNQFENPANPRVHYETTGAELARTLGKVDVFVAGIGSGGTITGVGRRLREEHSGVHITGVQPEGCDVLHGMAVAHRLQGFAVGMLPGVFDPRVVNDMESVTYEEAVACITALSRHEGLFVGISSGANVTAALRVAARAGRGKVVATIAPDGGRNYTDYLDDFQAHA